MAFISIPNLCKDLETCIRSHFVEDCRRQNFCSLILRVAGLESKRMCENLVEIKVKETPTLYLGLSIHDAGVDAVVSDIPFGVKHGTVDGVRQLLPKLVSSVHRYVLMSTA